LALSRNGQYSCTTAFLSGERTVLTNGEGVFT
jgi:V8-like Glu-specific endopeptidase